MSTLYITNKTIALGSRNYQISNITSVGKHRIKPDYNFNLGLTVTYVVLSLLGIVWIIKNPDIAGFKWFTLVVSILAAWGIYERYTKATKYGLSIEMSSGNTSKVLVSENENLIDDIIATINLVMNNQNTQANYTFNIAERDIINQRGVFETGVRTG